jgi:hypothetical protein
MRWLRPLAFGDGHGLTPDTPLLSISRPAASDTNTTASNDHL